MSTDQVGIVWIAGAPGAGKSAAAWALYLRLAAQGVRVAYVDIDQLGMLYPGPKDNPGAHRLKARALSALLPGYVAHGAQVVLVSGVVDPACGPRLAAGAASDLTLVVLTPDSGDLRERVLARGWDGHDADDAGEAVTVNDGLRRAAFADLIVDTAGLSVSETVDRILPVVRVAANGSRGSVQVRSSKAVTSVMAITGPRAAGSSTVGFRFASRRWQALMPTAFVDPEQLSFVSGSVDELATRQLAVMHEFMASHGAELLVVSGRPTVVNVHSLGVVAPAAPQLIVRLRADRATVERHVAERAQGRGARLAGDDLLGAGAKHLADVVARSVAEQTALDEASSANELVLDATGRATDELVDELDRLASDPTAWR